MKGLDKACSSACGTHEIYCCGSRVRISEKGPEALTKPTVGYCPLHEVMYRTKEINAQTVEKSVENKITGFGFCCRNRSLNAEPTVAYGASEMMSVWLEKRLIDCAVVVCEGAGTVITTNGKLVQGIGARLTGIIRTSPIREVIGGIESRGGVVLDNTTALIDQVEGVKRAVSMGLKHVAVCVTGFQSKAISEIRRFEKTKKVGVLVFSVCNTCVNETHVKHIAKADVVCASASRIIRKEIGSRALLQTGVTIPVYALTQKGKELILTYLTVLKDKLVVFRANQLPYDVKDRGPRLRDSRPTTRSRSRL